MLFGSFLLRLMESARVTSAFGDGGCRPGSAGREVLGRAGPVCVRVTGRRRAQTLRVVPDRPA